MVILGKQVNSQWKSLHFVDKKTLYGQIYINDKLIFYGQVLILLKCANSVDGFALYYQVHAVY